jgi:hypothetical protein
MRETAAKAPEGEEGGRPGDLVLVDPPGVGQHRRRVVVTAFVRAKKLGEEWDTRGLWAIFGGFGLIMVGDALSISTAPP